MPNLVGRLNACRIGALIGIEPACVDAVVQSPTDVRRKRVADNEDAAFVGMPHLLKDDVEDFGPRLRMANL